MKMLCLDSLVRLAETVGLHVWSSMHLWVVGQVDYSHQMNGSKLVDAFEQFPFGVVYGFAVYFGRGAIFEGYVIAA